jgi:hypothetical protein
MLTRQGLVKATDEAHEIDSGVSLTMLPLLAAFAFSRIAA